MGKIILGTNEVNKIYLGEQEVPKVYLGDVEVWSASSLPDWIDSGIEQILATLAPAATYWFDMAWTPNSPVQNYTQFYYRVFCTLDTPMSLQNPNSLTIYLQNEPSGFRGFTYYSWGFTTDRQWNLRYSYSNQTYCSFYDTILNSNHRAFISGNITSAISNDTGYPFEDYR